VEGGELLDYGIDGQTESVAERLGVDSAVIVFPRTPQEERGVIVEDFGPGEGHTVDIGNRIVRAARRWAVQLDNGGLVFVDDHELEAP
jgi:hypothetical protein